MGGTRLKSFSHRCFSLSLSLKAISISSVGSKKEEKGKKGLLVQMWMLTAVLARTQEVRPSQRKPTSLRDYVRRHTHTHTHTADRNADIKGAGVEGREGSEEHLMETEERGFLLYRDGKLSSFVGLLLRGMQTWKQ